MAKAKRQRRASFRTMNSDSAVSALDDLERLEALESSRAPVADPVGEGDESAAADDNDEASEA